MRYFEEFEALLEKMISSGILVIVEGRKDKKAMENIGISNVIELEKKPLYAFVEEISGMTDECIILTDLDKKGKQLYGRLSHDLQARGVRVDNKLRNFLFKKTKLRQIEGIDSYISRH